MSPYPRRRNLREIVAELGAWAVLIGWPLLILAAALSSQD